MFAGQRRSLEYLDLYPRDQNAGSSNGGKSTTKGGNQANNQNSMDGLTAGGMANINVGNQNLQKGGNAVGGR